MDNQTFYSASFNEAVLRAIEHSHHGRFGTDFVKILAAVGVTDPPSFKRKDLITWLSHCVPPSRGTDVELVGGPLVLAACIGLLRGESLLASHLSQDIEEALARHRACRKAKRLEKNSCENEGPSPPRDLPSAFVGSKSLLSEKIEDALSLLEGAAASNNLLPRHYQRVSRISEKADSFGKRPNKPAFASNLGSPNPVRKFIGGSAKDGNADPTENWGGAFRDHGRFGSHPSYDGMDDESGP